MIVKEVAMRSAKKSNFIGLANYLTGKQSKEERVGEISASNCYSEQAEVAVLEILNTQAQNTRAGSDKTYHLIVSFRAGEQLEAATLRSIEARICEGLGFGEHQRLSVVHHDTDNLHIHLAINKIHPRRHTIHTPYYSQKTLSRLCGELEQEFGLEPDNHQARKQAAENRADDMEHQAGIESLLGWIKRECYEEMLAARSWPELHQVMLHNGLVLHERGNGLVLSAADGTTVKASSLAREFSKNKLESRLGVFQPLRADQTKARADRHYERKPMRSRIDTAKLYARYQEEQRAIDTRRAEGWAKARARKNGRVESAKRQGRRKRMMLKLIQGANLSKKILHALVNNTLRKTLGQINAEYRQERQAIYDQHHHQAWADWLRFQATAGDPEALAALRAREVAQGLKGNTVGGNGHRHPIHHHPPLDSITKKGTIIYRLGATAVRDDGDRLHISRGADREGLQAALRMARERYGERLNVSGSTAFKEEVVQAAAWMHLPVIFDDPGLEQRRLELGRQMPWSDTDPSGEVVAAATAAEQAANQYIQEREKKRRQGLAIQRHSRFGADQGGPLLYAGTRQVAGQLLALLEREGEILVLPIDAPTASRLKRHAVGETLTVTPEGVIKTQGRSR